MTSLVQTPKKPASKPVPQMLLTPRQRHLAVNQFAALMQERRSGNSAHGAYRPLVGKRQAKALINHYAFMRDKRNRGLAYGYARNG